MKEEMVNGIIIVLLNLTLIKKISEEIHIIIPNKFNYELYK